MNTVPFLLFIIFGIIIISGYMNSIIKGIDLWNGITNKKLKKIYIFMIILSFISGIYLVYFYSTNKNKNNKLLYIGLSLLLIFSSIWAWFPYYNQKIVLFMVAIGSLLLLINNSIEFENKKENIIGIIACVILFIQTFGFDYILWSQNK